MPCDLCSWKTGGCAEMPCDLCRRKTGGCAEMTCDLCKRKTGGCAKMPCDLCRRKTGGCAEHSVAPTQCSTGFISITFGAVSRRRVNSLFLMSLASGLPGNLQSVYVPMLDHDVCQATYGAATVTDSVVCVDTTAEDGLCYVSLSF